MQPEIRRIRRISYIILAVIVVGFCLLAAFLVPRAYWNSFSPEKWQDHPDRRAFMLEDLLEHHPLKGMAESEVAALLGETDNEGAGFMEVDRSVYWLGEHRPGGIGEWLLIDFENGAVTAYRVTEDQQSPRSG